MRFLIDANLPPALATWLIAKGHDASHVADRQMASASDVVIWHFAVQTQSAIITKDEDFAKRKVLADDGPTVVWIRLPNTRRRQLLAWFDVALPALVSALERGETLIEMI
jgi:predicted nuclease of predicted toxin-antitoxin system